MQTLNNTIKNRCFEVLSSLILHNIKPFLNQIVKSDKKVDDNQQWLDQLLDWEEAPKHFPKPNLHQKKVMVAVWWSAAHLIQYSFWILVKPLHLTSMLSKLTRCTKNCNAWNWHWSTERAHFFPMTTPDHKSHNHSFKSWMNWATKFCFILTWPLTYLLSLLQASWQHFAGKALPHQQEEENAFE